MTGKRSAAQLRQMAKDLMAKARGLEEKELIEIGKIVKKWIDNGFSNGDFETVKKQLKELLSGKGD